MGEINWTVVVAAMSLEIVIISSAVGLVWKLSRSEMSIRAEFAEKIKEVSDKVFQVEIWARDEFVRRASFESSIARMERVVGEFRSEIAARLDKMTDRIEHFQNPRN